MIRSLPPVVERSLHVRDRDQRADDRSDSDETEHQSRCPSPTDVRSGDARHSSRQWGTDNRSEEHTSELQSQSNLVCRLLLDKKHTRTKHLLSPREAPPSVYD